MQFRILGTLDAEVDGGPIELGPPKQRALLAVLLLHLREVVPTERLIELVWGEGAPRTAAHSVQIYVSDLRKVLGPHGASILTKPPGYVLDADPASVDARRFEREVDAALAEIAEGSLSAGADRLRGALELWRGPALSEFVYEQFAQSDIRRLEERRRLAIEELARVELELGRGRLLIPQLEELIGRNPLAEEPRRLHMLALYSAGRQADALRSFQTYRRLLGDELGIAPSGQLQRLEEQILLQDPSLPGSFPAAERAVSGGIVRNPYKGLRPFGEADAEDYFGRGPLVADLARRLGEGQRLLVVTGPSGCGKSSLVRAGLVPTLRAGGSGWVVAQMMPGLRPFDELETALHRATPGGHLVALGEAATPPCWQRSPRSSLRRAAACSWWSISSRSCSPSSARRNVASSWTLSSRPWPTRGGGCRWWWPSGPTSTTGPSSTRDLPPCSSIRWSPCFRSARARWRRRW